MSAIDAELTLEADPVWLDQIRAEAEAGDAGEADPELTVDASPELVDVIRGEIARRDATTGDGATTVGGFDLDRCPVDARNAADRLRQRRRRTSSAERGATSRARRRDATARNAAGSRPLAAPAAARRPGAGGRHDADRALRQSPPHQGQHQDHPGGHRRRP